MAEKIIFRPPPEPAHVSIVRQYEDLVAILKYIREAGQSVIDQGFDRSFQPDRFCGRRRACLWP